MFQVIHYCCGSYDIGDFGGVAAYDHALKNVFKDRIFFRGPQQKLDMLRYLENVVKFTKVKPIVFTDNHLACDIPNTYFCFIVNHGCARRTAQMNPAWDKYWRDLCVTGQDKMLTYRDPKCTHIVSISQSTKDDFKLIYDEAYTKFDNTMIFHCSQFDEHVKKTYNEIGTSIKKPKILGNFGQKKGNIEPFRNSKLSQLYTFEQLNINGRNFKDVESFVSAKQGIYIDSDVFLQISNSEGFSYAALDAALCGLVIVSTEVGLFYEVPKDCFVVLDLDKIYDIPYIEKKIEYALENKAVLGAKIRSWTLENCSRQLFEKRTKDLVQASLHQG